MKALSGVAILEKDVNGDILQAWYVDGRNTIYEDLWFEYACRIIFTSYPTKEFRIDQNCCLETWNIIYVLLIEYIS